MTKGSAKSHARRPVNYWSKFNEWWRQVLEESGRRPDAAAINRWYEENARDIWAPNDMPTMVETRIHAKCLRSVDEVRNYFRAYRAQRRADAAARMDTGNGGDDHGDHSDSDVATTRGNGRKGGGGGKSTSNSSANLQRGGVSKVAGSSGRTAGRPPGQATARNPSAPYPRVHSHSHGGMGGGQGAIATAAPAGIGLADGSVTLNPWWHPNQALQAQAAVAAAAAANRPQVSAVSGGGAGSSAVITGFPHTSAADHMRYRAMSHTQPASPARADTSAVNGAEGRLDVDVGDLPYDGPCSSVSTASLDDLLGLGDEKDSDLTRGEVTFGAASNTDIGVAVGCNAGLQPGRGNGTDVLPPYQRQAQQPQPFMMPHQQQQQQPVLGLLGNSALADDFRSIFDDVIGMEPVLHAELTLLPPHPQKGPPQQPNQQQHLTLHMAGHAASARKDIQGPVQPAAWQPNADLAARPQFPSIPTISPPHGMANMGLSLGPPSQQQQQQQDQLPPPPPQQQQQFTPFFNDWQQAPSASGLGGRQKTAGGAAGAGAHVEQHGPGQSSGSSAHGWQCGGASQTAATSPATPMEDVAVSEPPSSKRSSNHASWQGAAEVTVKRGSPALGGSCGGSQSDVRDQQSQALPAQDQQCAGLSPDTTSSLSQAAPSAHVKSEPSEQLQLRQDNLWMGDAMDQGPGPTNCSGTLSQSHPQPTAPSQAAHSWRGPDVSPGSLQQGGSGAGPMDHEMHLQLMHVERFGPASIGNGQAQTVHSSHEQQLQPQPLHGMCLGGPSAQQQQQPRSDPIAGAAGKFGHPSLQLPPLPPPAPRSQCDRQQQQQQQQYRRSPSLGSATTALGSSFAPAPNSAVGGPSRVLSSGNTTPLPPAWGGPQLPPAWGGQQQQQSQQLPGRSHSFSSGCRDSMLQFGSAPGGLSLGQPLHVPSLQLSQQQSSSLAANLPPSLPGPFLVASASSSGVQSKSAANPGGPSASSQPAERSGSWPSIVDAKTLQLSGPNPFIASQLGHDAHRAPASFSGPPRPLPVPSLPLGALTRSGGASSEGGAPAGPVGSGPVFRRHSQPGGDVHSYMSALHQGHQGPQPHGQPQPPQELGMPIGSDCPMADLLAWWQRSDQPEPSQQQQPQQHQAQTGEVGAPMGAQKQQQSAGGPVSVPACGVAAQAAPRGMQGFAGLVTPVNCPALDPTAAGAPPAAPTPRPTLMRTFSAPAGDGTTPRSAAAAGAAVGNFSCLPNVPTLAGGAHQPSATPRQQHPLQAPPGMISASGFPTPGLGSSFASPPGGWGDRALAELEGDSMWLSAILAGNTTPPF